MLPKRLCRAATTKPRQIERSGFFLLDHNGKTRIYRPVACSFDVDISYYILCHVSQNVKGLAEVDLINSAEYEKSDLFSVKLELRGSNIEHQRHLSTNCSITTDQLLPNQESCLKVTKDNSIITGIKSKNGGLQSVGSNNGPSPLKKTDTS